jgi:hypothetical protein
MLRGRPKGLEIPLVAAAKSEDSELSTNLNEGFQSYAKLE